MNNDIITEEQWKEVEKHAREYQNLYMATPFGCMGAMAIARLLSRYEKGERTEDLYKRMKDIR